MHGAACPLVQGGFLTDPEVDFPIWKQIAAFGRCRKCHTNRGTSTWIRRREKLNFQTARFRPKPKIKIIDHFDIISYNTLVTVRKAFSNKNVEFSLTLHSYEEIYRTYCIRLHGVVVVNKSINIQLLNDGIEHGIRMVKKIILRIRITLMRILIQLLTWMRIRIRLFTVMRLRILI